MSEKGYKREIVGVSLEHLHDEEAKADINPCPERKDNGKCEFEISQFQALVVGCTCYNCVHCGRHKDTFNQSVFVKPKYSADYLNSI